YYAGTFHLINHAFFKACLFLGSGSVIHAVHTQEIGQMGGLWKKLPWTFGTWMVATLAIAGFPFTSGFFSKDAILLALTQGWDYELAGFGFLDPMNQTISASVRMLCMQGLVVGAFLTAAYMWRVTALTFFGKPREQERYDHAHESPILWVPLVVLAVMAIASGYIWANHLQPEQVSGFGYYPHYAAEALAESLNEAELAAYTLLKTRYDMWHTLLLFIAIPAGLGGLGVGFFFYNTAAGERVRGLVRGPGEKLFWVLKNKYFIDEIYWKTFVAGSNLLALFLAWWDREVVDGFVRAVGRYGLRLGDLSGWADREIVDGQFALGAAKAAYGMGKVMAKMQNGRVRVYLYQAVLTMAVLALVVAAVHG
ncbi:MAG: proton-conducting transporter transmembrane domain-containing protein, partial [Planctomycetota bacterium]